MISGRKPSPSSSRCRGNSDVFFATVNRVAVSGVTDGGQRGGSPTPPGKLNAKRGPPFCLYLGFSIVLFLGRSLLCVFGVISGVLGFWYNHPHPDSPSFLTFSLVFAQKQRSAFPQVLPTCYEDELLLANLTYLLDKMLMVVERRTVDDFDDVSLSIVTWLLEKCLLNATCKTQQLMENAGSPFFRVLESSAPQPEPVGGQGPGTSDARLSSVAVRRHLCKAILSMLSRLSRLILRAPGVQSEVSCCLKIERSQGLRNNNAEVYCSSTDCWSGTLYCAVTM